MDRQSNSYTFVFALSVCVICSFSLSLVSEGLKEKKDLNVALDIKKNILKAVSLKDPLPGKANPREILGIYEQKIQEIVVDGQGNVVDGRAPKDIREGEAAYPVYVYKEGQQVMAYCVPVAGKGLWSTLYGYLALETDAVTVRGITFYKHGETPGLGAEIEKEWFQSNFEGKKIWDEKAMVLRPVSVVKGKVPETVSAENAKFLVDGISGATMTTKGVNALMDKGLRVYEPFFKKVRSPS